MPFGGFPVVSFDPAAAAAPQPPSLDELVPPVIVSIVLSTFLMPFSIGVTGLLYIDQRIRRERYDIELARSAAEHG